MEYRGARGRMNADVFHGSHGDRSILSHDFTRQRNNRYNTLSSIVRDIARLCTGYKD